MNEIALGTSGMTELVKITNNVIGDREVNSVDARELWKALESKRQFANWVETKVLKSPFFVEHRDYEVFNNSVNNPTGGRPQTNYLIETKAAKKIAMSEQTAVGNKVRDYFIECEAIALQNSASGFTLTQLSTVTPALADTYGATLRIAGMVGLTGNQAILSTNRAVKKLHGVDCLALLEVPALATPGNIQYFTPTLLGKRVGLSAIKLNALMEAAGLQVKEMDYKDRVQWTVTDLGKEHCLITDTGKRHGDGSMVRQVKWADSIIPICESLEVPA